MADLAIAFKNKCGLPFVITEHWSKMNNEEIDEECEDMAYTYKCADSVITVSKALKDSLAAEFVNRYKDGLDHEIEEGGSNLSGGQKQRLLIARALLAGREILILDDSTSALDYKSDSLLRKNVKKRKLTLILVSQRATSVKDMDRIYVLDQGKVVAVGKHEELLSSCSIYQEIYQTQVAVK
jgi:ATP-binding cassette subfamily B protein